MNKPTNNNKKNPKKTKWAKIVDFAREWFEVTAGLFLVLISTLFRFFAQLVVITLTITLIYHRIVFGSAMLFFKKVQVFAQEVILSLPIIESSVVFIVASYFFWRFSSRARWILGYRFFSELCLYFFFIGCVFYFLYFSSFFMLI